MTRFARKLLFPAVAAAFVIAGSGVAVAEDAMMADCMNKAKMETDATKMAAMEKDCHANAMKTDAMKSDAMSSSAMKSDAMKSDAMSTDAMAPKKK